MEQDEAIAAARRTIDTTEATAEFDPPTLNGDRWTAFSSLALVTNPDASRSVAIIDRDARLWITTREGARVDALSTSEALALCGFLVEHFGIAVVNDPEAWGDEPNRCSCEQVPAIVACGGCRETFHTIGPSGRLEWESERTREASS